MKLCSLLLLLCSVVLASAKLKKTVIEKHPKHDEIMGKYASMCSMIETGIKHDTFSSMCTSMWNRYAIECAGEAPRGLNGDQMNEYQTNCAQKKICYKMEDHIDDLLLSVKKEMTEPSLELIVFMYAMAIRIKYVCTCLDNNLTV
eukprot:60783_1